MTLFDRTAFQRDLLFIIASEDRPSGQDVKARFEAAAETDVNRGNVYPNLDVLVEEGFVEKGRLDSRSNYYVLTEKGERCLRRRREWERTQLEPASKAEP